MLLNARRVPPAPRRMCVSERAVVVPDRADIVGVGLEEELRRGVNAARSRATVRAVRRFTRLGGAWLGLSIVRRVVEAHGGAMGVEANAGSGGGNTFWFTIPAPLVPVS